MLQEEVGKRTMHRIFPLLLAGQMRQDSAVREHEGLDVSPAEAEKDA